MDRRHKPDALSMHSGPLDRRSSRSARAERDPALDRWGARLPTSRVLVVEDQQDLRHMLVTALQIEGYQVDEAATASEGLKRLTLSRYDLVLSDYAMPGGTGTWMLHEASRLGLMEATRSIIVTAHPDVRQIGNVEVISKPLDLDLFLAQVSRILAAPRAGDDPGAAGSAASRHSVRTPPKVRYRAELVLYISSASPASMQARRNLERILTGFDVSQVKFSLCDLEENPGAGETDRVAFTPTLVRRFPEPRLWVVGNLREPEIVKDLLRACGVDARA